MHVIYVYNMRTKRTAVGVSTKRRTRSKNKKLPMVFHICHSSSSLSTRFQPPTNSNLLQASSLYKDERSKKNPALFVHMIITSKCRDKSATSSGIFSVATDPEHAIRHLGRPVAVVPLPNVLTDSLILFTVLTSASRDNYYNCSEFADHNGPSFSRLTHVSIYIHY